MGEVKTPVSYDRKTGYIVDAEGFNVAHCYVNEWALELVDLINDTSNARAECLKMANAIDDMYRHNEATRVGVVMYYGSTHGPFVTKMRSQKREIGNV